MQPGQMTIKQIESILAVNDVAPELVEKIKSDPRVTVNRLLQKWLNRRNTEKNETKRLKKLFHYENSFQKDGIRLIAGVDEAGRGPLAGPLVIAAVILPDKYYLTGLDDSKKLSAKQREILYKSITKDAIAVNYQVVPVEEIDKLNIYQATLCAMYQSLANLTPTPQAALIDAMPLHNLTIPNLSLIHGDQLSASIAAASIVAKVERDKIMNYLDKQYPQYRFSHHKGYATAEHLALLKEYGPSPVHRKSFSPIKNCGAKFVQQCLNK